MPMVRARLLGLDKAHSFSEDSWMLGEESYNRAEPSRP